MTPTASPPALLRAPLRPEAKLLFLTAWGRSADASIVELASRITSWPWFIAVAELERASRVVWERLSSLGVHPTPPESERQLQHLASIAAFNAEHLRARLQETLAVFERERVEVILLKGAALANTVYPSFIERPMGDVDLMVRPDDAERAHAIARKAGWTWDAQQFPSERYAGHHHLPPLDDASRTGVRLELHKGIAIDGHPFALGFEELRSQASDQRFGDVTVKVPSTVHLLLHECVHFAWSHVLSFGAWRTMRDIQLMGDRRCVDWEEFASEVRRHRADSCAYWTLSLARFLAGADVPERTLRDIQPRIGGLMRRFLTRHFIYHLIPNESDWPSHRLRQVLWEAAIQPARYGHGNRRPWELDDRSPEPTMQYAAGGSEGSGMGNRRSRIGVWARYVRALS